MAPPPAQAPAASSGGGGGMLSGLAGTVMQGMAFGGGSAVANRAIDSVMGPRQVEHVHSGAPPAAPAADGTFFLPICLASVSLPFCGFPFFCLPVCT